MKLQSAGLKRQNNPFVAHIIRNSSKEFPATIPTTASCSLNNSEDLIAKIKERMNGKIEISPSATVPITEYSDGETRSPANGLSVDVCARLCLVDQLQDLGVDRFFQSEIQNVLHHAFRLWEKKDEEIFGDVACRAMAFRLLRLEGYHVSSDALGEYDDEENFFNTVSLESSGAETVVELYKASQVRLPEDDDGILEKLHDWTFKFLKQQLKSKKILDKKLERKVEFNLKNYHGILDAVKHRRSIDLLFDVDHTTTFNTASSRHAVYNEDLFLLSAQDFMTRQAQNLKELPLFLRWYEECRFDKMGFGRDVIRVSHFISANNIPDPQLSEARLAFAKTMNLVTRLDDFFDHRGSREECLFIIELTRQWNEPSSIEFPSEEVEMLYSALHSTVTDIAEKAYPIQGRCIKPLLIHLWVELLTSSMREMDWCTAEIPPTMDEYLGFAWISVGGRVSILVAIHFLGEKLSEELVMGEECTQLCKHLGSLSRLLNDISGFQRESEENTVNGMMIQLNADEKMSEEEAASNLEKIAEHHRKELLKMVVQREGSMVPKKCKDVFWKACNVSYYLYTRTDEFTSPLQMKEDMKLLFHDPFPSLPL